MLFVPFSSYPHIWGHFSQVLRTYDLLPPPSTGSTLFHRVSLCFLFGEMGCSLSISLSLCVCVSHPNQVVFMASALRVLMKELASVIQSVSMSGCHLLAIENQQGLRLRSSFNWKFVQIFFFFPFYLCLTLFSPKFHRINANKLRQKYQKYYMICHVYHLL